MQNQSDLIQQSINYINVSGGKIFTELLFTQSNKDLMPIIFLHGGPGGNHSKFKWGLKQLAIKFPLIFYDQIGGGFSKKIDQDVNKLQLWTIQNFVQELKCLIEFYNLQSFILMGSSWGCALAMQYYFSKETEKKPKAIVFNSPYLSTSRWLQDANILKKQLPEQIYKVLVECQKNNETKKPQYIAGTDVFNNKHLIRYQLLNQEQVNLLNTFNPLFNVEVYEYMWGPNQFFVTGTLLNYCKVQQIKEIKVPLLFTCGEHDEARPETVQSFHKLSVNSQFKVFKDCSHCSFFQNSALYRQVLENFYNKVKSQL